jgi:L-Ala-D/L-Glu epimerase / N-acetyl-D-glutamate racemase
VKIEAVETMHQRLPLTQPYTISSETFSDVELGFVSIRGGGMTGYGCASPAPEVTGETAALSTAALDAARSLLIGQDASDIDGLARRLEYEFANAPAARAACDMALWDLAGQSRGAAVADVLGRLHSALPTSVTIGIQSTQAALDAAREYVARGFKALKIKLGRDVEEDIDRLRQLRALVGSEVALRTDPNAGYDADVLRQYLDGTRELQIEFCEQPVPRTLDAALREFSDDERARFAADESVLDLADAKQLLQSPRSYGIFNLKLMKCGGITPARQIARLAHDGGVSLMWGCNDESRISIAAALHVALASPATRYLDLDGSFDLSRDPAEGGFVLEDGLMRTAPGAGLGVRWIG